MFLKNLSQSLTDLFWKAQKMLPDGHQDHLLGYSVSSVTFLLFSSSSVEGCMGLQMHRNSKIVCTALGTVLSHQSTAQFHSQNYYVTFSWGFLLLHTKSLNNGRKDFNTIANSNDLLILFFLLIPYLHLLTIIFLIQLLFSYLFSLACRSFFYIQY